MLKRPNHGCADGDDAAPFLFCPHHRLDRIGGKHILLLVHAMLGRIGNLYRKECAGSDVQGQESAPDPSFPKRRQQPIGKVKSRGRRGDGATDTLTHTRDDEPHVRRREASK